MILTQSQWEEMEGKVEMGGKVETVDKEVVLLELAATVHWSHYSYARN